MVEEETVKYHVLSIVSEKEFSGQLDQIQDLCKAKSRLWSHTSLLNSDLRHLSSTWSATILSSGKCSRPNAAMLFISLHRLPAQYLISY